jgi:L-histidine N-alpha-methyltransferase
MPEALTEPALYGATRRSLGAEAKELPAVWLYDERGSKLYEQITRLREYYLPQREAEILSVRAAEIAGRTKARTLVELGSGNARNTRFLLDALESAGMLERFAPFDVSEEMVRASARELATAYPRISVEAIVGDFERDLAELPQEGPRLIALLGSTIGNLYPEQRAVLLTTLAGELGDDDRLLLGVDLVKDVARLEAAYHDRGGVTEAFVRNALTHVNRELDATFEQEDFAYEPRWDPEHEWMDIGLRSREAHSVSLRRLGFELAFEKEQHLRVEISAKFRRERFELELARGGLRNEEWWTDPAGDFAVVLVRPDRGGYERERRRHVHEPHLQPPRPDRGDRPPRDD